MNTRKVSRHRHVASTILDSSAADSTAPVTIESSTRRDTRPAAANEDALTETRVKMVNPLWMVTVGLAILFALLAIFSVSG